MQLTSYNSMLRRRVLPAGVLPACLSLLIGLYAIWSTLGDMNYLAKWPERNFTFYRIFDLNAIGRPDVFLNNLLLGPTVNHFGFGLVYILHGVILVTGLVLGISALRSLRKATIWRGWYRFSQVGALSSIAGLISWLLFWTPGLLLAHF